MIYDVLPTATIVGFAHEHAQQSSFSHFTVPPTPLSLPERGRDFSKNKTTRALRKLWVVAHVSNIVLVRQWTWNCMEQSPDNRSKDRSKFDLCPQPFMVERTFVTRFVGKGTTEMKISSARESLFSLQIMHDSLPTFLFQTNFKWTFRHAGISACGCRFNPRMLPGHMEVTTW